MLINGDCIEEMKTLISDGVQVDSVVCDPPYEIGFMGKGWDSTGIAFQKETWELAFQLLKPGGHLLAFSGSRTYHRMAVAVEDAGFEIRDQIMWLFGSGFPKSLNIGKSVDKKLGNKREVVGKGNSEWEGWGTALKPAHEPVVMARKPVSEKTVAENVLKHGTGGINIDGCRVETEEVLDYGTGKKSNVGFKTSPQNNNRPVYDGKGRFPANLIHDGLEEDWARFFYCPKVSKSERGVNNNHPTVKPIKLMEYLCRLVTPKGGIVLDPFMGSGTTIIAAKNGGFKYIGIEKEKEYFEIANSRIDNQSKNLVDFLG